MIDEPAWDVPAWVAAESVHDFAELAESGAYDGRNQDYYTVLRLEQERRECRPRALKSAPIDSEETSDAVKSILEGKGVPYKETTYNLWVADGQPEQVKTLLQELGAEWSCKRSAWYLRKQVA